jgi:hypothetical protein
LLFGDGNPVNLPEGAFVYMTDRDVHNLFLDQLGGEGTLETDVIKFGYDVGAVVWIVEDGRIVCESIYAERLLA